MNKSILAEDKIKLLLFSILGEERRNLKTRKRKDGEMAERLSKIIVETMDQRY